MPDLKIAKQPKAEGKDEVSMDIRDEKMEKLNLENIELQMQIFDLQTKVSDLNEELSNVELNSKSNHFEIIDKEI